MTDKEFSELRKISQIKPMDLSAAKAYQDLEAKTANIYMLSGMTLDDIVYHLMKGDVFVSLDFINRQKAEIEQLEKDKESFANSYAKAVARNLTIKAEAVKEFAERLKEELEGEYIKATNKLENAQNIVVSTNIKIVDNLAEEMVGE